MGAWGAGSFENDDALDWLFDLKTRGAPHVAEAITSITSLADTGYIEAPDATIALAAAEVIAAVRTGDEGRLPDDAREALTALRGGGRIEALSDPLLTSKAHAAVSRILARSELQELWDETDDAEAWRGAVSGLLGRLG